MRAKSPCGGVLDKCPVSRHIDAMPTRKTLSADVILLALRASNEDPDAAATLLNVTTRTLQRRMAELGIRARVRYEIAAADAA